MKDIKIEIIYKYSEQGIYNSFIEKLKTEGWVVESDAALTKKGSIYQFEIILSREIKRYERQI